MTDYTPPLENLPIFDKIVFITGDSTITQNQADKRYLRYPIAQGTETFGDINVAGTANINNLNLTGQLSVTKRIYQNLNPSWPSIDGYYGLAQDAYPLPLKSANGLKAGASWDLRTLNTNQWFGICWSPQLLLFVATAQTGTNNRIATSSDGINWTIRTSVNNSSVFRNIVWSYENNLFVVIGSSGVSTDSVSYSSDGITWNSLTPPNTSNWFNITWASELKLFVAVADFAPTNICVMTSPDGLTWTNRSTPSNSSMRGICWSAELGLLIAVASTGPDRIFKSTDGINWSVVPLANTQAWFSVCWSKELGIFVAVSIDTTVITSVMTSPDGNNWTLRNTPNTNGYRSVCWSSQLGIFVAVGNVGTNNRIITSPDGINWTSQTSNSNDWRNVCWSAELGIFCGVSITPVATSVMTSSLLWRPPTSVNTFNSIFNSIDSLGNWAIKGKSFFSNDSNISIIPLSFVSIFGDINMNMKNISNINTLFLNDNSVANMLLKYTDSTGELGFTTTKTGGKYNFYSFDGSSNVSLLELQQTQIIPKVNMAFPANINLTMASGTGLITQATPVSLSTTMNTLRMTNIISNYAGPSPLSTCQIYDGSSIGRGFLFIVNAQGGNYNPIVQANDALITTRFRPTGEGVGITIAAQCSVGCGMRVYSPTDPQAQLTLRTGTSTIVMSNYATNPISVNDRIYMGNTTLATRRVDNVSVLNLFDTSNSTGVMEMLVDSPSSTVQYRSLTNNFYHLFYVTNGSSITNSRFTIADGNVSTIGCPFHVRTATTTTRLEFNPQTDGSTDFFGTNSSSLNSSINIKLRNSSNSIITTQVFSPTLITENVPTTTSSVTPSLSSQNGYIGTNVYSSGAITSSTTIANFFSFTFTDVGTYTVSVNRQLSNSDGSTITVNQWYSGFSASINTIDLPSGGSLYSTSTLRQYSFTILASTDLALGACSMVLRINAPNTTIYYNGFISHTATNLGLRVMMSYAKIY